MGEKVWFWVARDWRRLYIRCKEQRNRQDAQLLKIVQRLHPCTGKPGQLYIPCFHSLQVRTFPITQLVQLLPLPSASVTTDTDVNCLDRCVEVAGRSCNLKSLPYTTLRMMTEIEHLKFIMASVHRICQQLKTMGHLCCEISNIRELKMGIAVQLYWLQDIEAVDDNVEWNGDCSTLCLSNGCDATTSWRRQAPIVRTLTHETNVPRS